MTHRKWNKSYKDWRDYGAVDFTDHELDDREEEYERVNDELDDL